MKGELFWSRIRRPPRLRRIDIVITLVPALVWAAAFRARPAVIEPRCANDPQACAQETVFLPDQLALGLESGKADSVSFIAQDWSGYLALAIPAVWVLGRLAARGLSPAAALASIGTDAVLLLQGALWNGTVNETIRLLVQRPRPFVYADPGRLGQDPAHYTSFYSGHTSFSAVAGTSLVLALVSRGAPAWLAAVAAAGASGLVFVTALTRVLAGRHFVTDVLMGALFGALIALAIGYLHRVPARRP
jgi:membrane-associated phospholipid phosphatase